MRFAMRLLALAGAAAIALSLASCATPDDGGPDPQLRGQWELASAKDPGGTIDLLDQRISLTIAGDTTTTGRSSCSNYHARVFGTDAQLWVTATLPRKTDCGTQIQEDMENRYINDLNAVRSATVNDGILDLTARGIDLRFERALHVPLTLMVDRNWDLTGVTAVGLVPAPIQPPVIVSGATLRFETSGVFTGYTACSTLKGRWTQNAGQIVVAPLTVKTRAACDEDQEAVDTYVVEVVQSSFTFQQANRALQIASERVGIQLEFAQG